MSETTRVRSPVRPVTRIAVTGLAGSVLLSAASYWVGAVPIYFRHEHVPVVSLLPISSIPPRIAYYVGLTLLLLAWLWLGRTILDKDAGSTSLDGDGAGDDHPDIGWRTVRRIALLWLAPMLLATPLASRDLWAYAAQSQLVRHGLNPYTSGPSALPGPFAIEVSHLWVSTPAPYGPLWLSLGRLIAIVLGNDVTLTTFVLRLVAAGGLLLIAATLPTLAGRAGGRAELAMWVVVANPLVLVLGVGGGHNDMLMLGLMLAGLVVVTAPGRTWSALAIGSALLAAAVAIKSPAVVALAFAVPLWLVAPATGGRSAADPPGDAQRSVRAPARPADQRLVDVRRIGLACCVVGGVGVGVFAAITAASGLGLGWVKQVNSAVPIVSWMSLPTLLTIGWNFAHGITHGTTKLNATMRDFRSAGTIATFIGLPLLWWVGLRRAVWPALAAALLLVVVLGAAVQPWYFCWALVIAATFVTGRRPLTWIAGWSLALVVMIQPSGKGFQMHPQVVPIIVGSLAISWYLLERRQRCDG